MSGYWKTPSGANVPGGTPFTEEGQYEWQPPNYGTNIDYSFGGRGAFPGSTGALQLQGELAGKRVNIGSNTTVTYAAPQIWPSTFRRDGKIFLIISALTGSVVVEIAP